MMAETVTGSASHDDGGDALRAAAWANVVLHVAGLALAVVFMKPGTPAVTLLERIAYLAPRPPGWIAGWVVWMACAVALAAFMVLLARQSPAPLVRAAAWVALLGAALDVACDVAYVAALPAHARGDIAAFVAFERRLTALSQTGANGLYSVAVLLCTVGLGRAGPLVRLVGGLVFAGGLLLAVAGLTGDPRQVVAGTAIAIPAFLAWTLLVSSRRAP
jgi:hypothetical protein